MSYRTITPQEIPIVADIQSRAFRFPAERYLEAYNGSGRVDHTALRLLENEQGQPVAALNIFTRPVSLNGGEVDAGLVASVAVPPEERRCGYAGRLMAGLLDELYARQTPLSLLFPFSVAYYRRLGYGLANFTWYMELAPRLLPDYPERREVRRAGPDDEAALRACHEAARCLPQNNGWPGRGDWEWRNKVTKPEHEKAVFVIDGQMEGYLVFTLTWSPAATPAKVLEWVWTTERAWRGLAGFLAALGEQATTVSYNAPQGSPLLCALPEPYDRGQGPAEFTFYPAARLVNGFMLRVVHLPSALTVRRYPAHVTAEFVLQVEDPQLPANGAPLHVRITDGAAAVEKTSASPQVRTDMATWSQLYAGAMTAEQARTVGALHGDDAACAALSAAFTAAPWSMHPADWF
ncbi:MAG TPA: GNAT family N-acetyltransferase [Anaerolineae bacterium]|nr:GNAT family N-acetyltransferase [Anaerolineae bacterium]